MSLPLPDVCRVLRSGIAAAGKAPARAEGETGHAMAQRLLVDPVYAGATDGEIAADAATTASVVRRARAELDETTIASTRIDVEYGRVHALAAQVAEDIGWTDRDGELADLVVAALTDYALRHCAAGRCTHELCARQRREKARDDARQRLARPPHDTRHQPAPSASDRRFLPARGPGHQPRGALPGRTGGGA